ncbi:hypothetical protein BKA83DRAFT_4041619, partial [Pisolithus microcarpus]
SRLDFEFAELVLEAALSKEQINRFLKLIKSACCGSDPFTLNEYSNLHSTWRWELTWDLVAFDRCRCIGTLYTKDGEPHEFPMYYRPLMDWATNLLKHPGIGPHFIFDAVRLFTFDGSTFVHFIDEPWTAAKFWNVQVHMYTM